VRTGVTIAAPGRTSLDIGPILRTKPGTELSAKAELLPVLGRTALGSQFWLAQVAKRDQLAVTVRAVIGLGVPLPQQNSGGG